MKKVAVRILKMISRGWVLQSYRVENPMTRTGFATRYQLAKNKRLASARADLVVELRSAGFICLDGTLTDAGRILAQGDAK